jgi:hypothetical protein
VRDSGFRAHGIDYRRADKPKSAIYLELLGPLYSGQVELLDHPRLIHQLCAPERRTARNVKDSSEHPPNGHDDVINAVAGGADRLQRGQLSGRLGPLVALPSQPTEGAATGGYGLRRCP